MGGANIQCGEFEGEDKSGSPASSVLAEAFKRAFGRKPRGRIAFALRNIFGSRRTAIQEAAELALLSVEFEEVGRIPSEVAVQLLPFLKDYNAEIRARFGISDVEEDLDKHMKPSSNAKYGFVHDDGWHAYCLHDLVLACERSRETGLDVEIIW
jgi:hypothetical protein